MTAKIQPKKIQANVDRRVASQAEDIMNELGVTPTVVINALYRRIIATGEIPFSFSLTAEERNALAIKQLAASRPTKVIQTKQDFEDFFDED